ncbi:helix-turn-helix domain-containing protein [Andreprevotia lacus]|uniref:helix-turn-helix domain-containing protein n=1 Tax=Andreprevotia lacus TaxID=1121000 RepID=UPI00111C82ED|nr:helix-turn-helix transcriptional regulator [Andreprevotia lacus]
MENLEEIIEEAKKASGCESYSDLARKLGVTHGTVSHWRTGRSTPDAYALMELQKLLKIDARQLLAIIEAERAKTEERRGYWEEVKRSFSSSGSTIAAVALAATIALFGNPSVTAEQANTYKYTSLPLYIM